MNVLNTWTKHPLTALTAVVAMVYGIGFALPDLTGGPSELWVTAGAAICGALFAGSIAAAFARHAGRGRDAEQA